MFPLTSINSNCAAFCTLGSSAIHFHGSIGSRGFGAPVFVRCFAIAIRGLRKDKMLFILSLNIRPCGKGCPVTFIKA